jgi:hypothetical protein
VVDVVERELRRARLAHDKPPSYQGCLEKRRACSRHPPATT